MFKKLKQAKRRLHQGVLASFDMAERTDDAAFEALFEGFEAASSGVGALEAALREYAETARAMQMAAGKVAAAALHIYDVDAPQRQAAQAWVNLQYREHDRLLEAFHAKVGGEVHRAVAQHMEVVGRVAEVAEKRKRKLTDVDAYRRQLRQAREKKKADLAAVQRKEEKLRAAEDVFQRLDKDLVKLCSSYEAYRRTMLNEQMAALAAAQQALFEGAAEQLAAPLRPVVAEFAAGIDTATSLPTLTAAFERLLEEDLHTENLAAADGGDLGVPEPVSPVMSSRVPGGAGAVPGLGISGPLCRTTERQPFEKPFSERHREMAPPAVASSTSDREALARSDPQRSPESGGSGGEPRFLGALGESMSGTSLESYSEPGSAPGERSVSSSAAGKSAAAPPPPPPPGAAPTGGGKQFVTATYDYEAGGDDELSFSYGDVLTVISTDASGWWFGELNGKQGQFPANYTDAPV